MAEHYRFWVKNQTKSPITFVAMQRGQASSGHGSGKHAHNCMGSVSNRWSEKTVLPGETISALTSNSGTITCYTNPFWQWFWFKPMEGYQNLRFRVSDYKVWAGSEFRDGVGKLKIHVNRRTVVVSSRDN